MQVGATLVKVAIAVWLLFLSATFVLAGSGVDVAQMAQKSFPGAPAIARAMAFANALLSGSRLEGHSVLVGLVLFVCALLVIRSGV